MWIIVSLMLLTGTGCGDRRILEKTGVIHSISYDAQPDDNIKIAISIPSIDPQREASSIFLTTVAKSSKEARINLSRETDLILGNGQLRTALFGLASAKNGIWNQMDTFIRDPATTSRLKIVMVNGEAASLLERKYKEHPRTEVYVDRLLKKEAQFQSIPETTLYSFTRDYYDDGIDPVVPIIKEADDSVMVDGIGLFRGDQYISRIPPQDSLIFAFLYGKFQGGEMSIDLSDETQESKIAMLTAVTSSRKIKINHEQDGKISVNVDIQAQASVLEYIGTLELSNEDDEIQLEREISEHLTRRAERIVKLMQDNKTDSIGIGSYVRNSMAYKDWKAINWHEEFPKVNVQCKIALTFKDYGFRY